MSVSVNSYDWTPTIFPLLPNPRRSPLSMSLPKSEFSYNTAIRAFGLFAAM
jgi:hypothetical protein